MSVTYDTVNFWVSGLLIENARPFSIVKYLSEVTRLSKINNGECQIMFTGKIGNEYKVTVFPHGISLKGSLSKLMFGSNIHSLTQKDAGLAIEKLSDLSHLNITQAKVTRLDVAANLTTSQLPSCYFNTLGHKAYLERLETSSSTLEYRSKQKGLIFYDKIAQMQAKKIILPEEFEGLNLLRYELRYTKKLLKQLNILEVNGGLLADKNFYHSLAQCWKAEYDSINKIQTIQIDVSKIATPKQALDALFGLLLREAGQTEIDQFIRSLKNRKVFGDPKYYTRTSKELNRILTMRIGEDKELLEELNLLISYAAKSVE